MKVYVRWYKNVVEGELLDGEWQGMKQVRIPLDGCHPVALFAPEHVYQTEDEARDCKYHKNVEERSCGGPRKSTSITEPHKPQPKSSTLPQVDLDNEALLVWVRYKHEHWDQEHNHLRTDCLDEFYRLWRECHCVTIIMPDSPCYPPFMKSELTTGKPPAKPVPVAKPKAKPTKQNTVQLSLFD